MKPMLNSKRVCSVLLLGVLMLSLMLSPMLQAQAETAVSLGDINADGKVDITDAFLVYRYVSGDGSVDLSKWQKTASDVNSDQAINMRDAQLLYRVVSGQTTLPTLTSVTPQPSSTLTALDPKQYYGRQLLAAQDSRLCNAYDSFGEQVNRLQTQIELEAYDLTFAELQRVVQYYYDDHPEVFWLTLSYTYWVYPQTGYISRLDINYDMSSEQIAAYQTQLEAAADAMLEGITDDISPLEREKLLHDRLIRACDYDTTLSNDNIYTPIGALIDGTAVCEGYSRAFQYLLYRAGIPCILVRGYSLSASQGHMWNAVQLGEEWYLVDTTWDDPVFSVPEPSYVGYTYFNLTTEQMDIDHVQEDRYCDKDSSYQISYPIPLCTAQDANYKVMSAVALDSFDIEIMAPVIAQSVRDGGSAYFRPSYSTTDAFCDEFADAEKLYVLVDEINAYLAEEPSLQIGHVGYISYSFDIDDTTGIVAVYLR